MKHSISKRSLIPVLVPGLMLAFVGASGANAQDKSLEQLKSILGDDRPRILTLPQPPSHPLGEVKVDPELSPKDKLRTRVVKSGVMVTRDQTLSATVVEIARNVVRLSGDYAIGLRLPESHAVPLKVDEQVGIDYRPSSINGALGATLTITQDGAGNGAPSRAPLLLQVVQQGGDTQVTIANAAFTVAQTERLTMLQESKTDRTYGVTTELRVGGGRPITLEAGTPQRFSAGGRSYLITLLRSEYYTHHADAYSFEGPAYYLEYVVSQTGR